MKIRNVPIEKINTSLAVWVRDKKKPDPKVVEQYMEVFDRLPPIVVFDVSGDGLVLSDGMHRLSAAMGLELSKTKAEVRQGTIEDAQEYAIVANATHGLPMTAKERNRAAKRLLELHPTWADTKIGSKIGLNNSTVANLRAAMAVRQTLGETTVGDLQLSDSQLTEIYDAFPTDKDKWRLMAERVAGMSVLQTREYIEEIKRREETEKEALKKQEEEETAEDGQEVEDETTEEPSDEDEEDDDQQRVTQEEWDKHPDTKEVLDWVSRTRNKTLELFRGSARLFKIQADGRTFVARRVRDLITDLEELAQELEAETDARAT